MGLCPLVTVTGLTGGAGTTSLALALACAAADAAGRPSLVAETADNGLTDIARVASPFSLHDVPRLAEAAERPPTLWANVGAARVMTCTGSARDPNAIELSVACRAHSLVVLDCGRHEPERVPGGAHRVYVTAATAAGLAPLERRSPPIGATLAIVAVHPRPRLSLEKIRWSAARVCETVVLAPHRAELVTHPARARELLVPTARDLLAVIQRGT